MFEVPQHREEGVMSQKDFHRKFGLTDGNHRKGKEITEKSVFFKETGSSCGRSEGSSHKDLDISWPKPNFLFCWECGDIDELLGNRKPLMRNDNIQKEGNPLYLRLLSL